MFLYLFPTVQPSFHPNGGSMLNRFSVKGRMYLVILSIVFLFGLML